MAKALLKSLARKVGYLLAALIILAAVLVCIARFVSPWLDRYRGDFESIASQFIQNPVTIKHVRISWYEYQPVIGLNGITILDKQAKTPIFQIKKIRVLLSIPQSIWQRKIVTTGVVVAGANINIQQSATGKWSVQELSSLNINQQSDNKSEVNFVDVAGWLSQMPRLILRNIDVHYTSLKQKRFITLYNISFENTSDQHKLLGKAILHQQVPTEVTLTAQWEGKTFDLAQIKAEVYLYISGLSIPQWYPGLSWKDWQINEGIISTKCWLQWRNGAVQQIQTTFQSYGLSLYSAVDKSTHKINRVSGNVGWKRQDDTFVIAGDDILLDFPAHLWPATNFYILLKNDAQGVKSIKSAEFGYIDLNDVQSFISSSTDLLSSEVMKALSILKVKGSLQNVTIAFPDTWNDWRHLSASATFSNLTFSPWQQVPGVTNVTGFLQWDGSLGKVKLNSKDTQFQVNSVFENPIDLDQLDGDLQVQVNQDNQWLLRILSMQLLNRDVAANVGGTITVSANQSPVADIQANVTMQQAMHITRYLPMQTFNKNLRTWLNQAFLSGEVPSAHIVLRGLLKDFPFDNGKGEFNITGQIKHVDFRFAPDWPGIQQISGALTFAGRKITMDVDHAETLGIPLPRIHGVIPAVGGSQPQILNIESKDPIQTDSAKGLKYIYASPLKRSIGKMFAGADMQGMMSLKLGLIIPLDYPDKTKVQGDLTLNDSAVDFIPWDFKLTKLDGRILFTEATVTAKNIQAEFFNSPIQFDLSTKLAKKSSLIQASFTHHLQIANLESWLKLPFSQVVTGATDIKGSVDFSLSAPFVIHVQSNLVGAAVNLIDQYGKKVNESRNFSSDITLQSGQPLRMKLTYGQLFNAAIIMQRYQDKYRLTGATLGFGNQNVNWPASPGIYIIGQFDHLDWDKIKSYANQSTQSQSSAQSILATTKLKEIDVRANQVDIVNQTFTQVHLQARPDQNNWVVNVASSELVGQFTLPAHFSRDALITASIKRINIHSAANSTQSSPLYDINKMPGISLEASNVEYNGMLLGNVIFKANPVKDGLAIQALQITSPRLDFRASGDWGQDSNGYTTHLKGRATSSRVSELLQSLGLAVQNFISNDGNLDFNLFWHDAPYAPSITHMQGQASLDLGPGRIVDIGQGNGAKMDLGRMLSIFSLQTIPRRLSLNFSDLFQKGYSFDSVRGEMTIKDGNVFTKNLRFEGPVAKVGIDGRIGLSDKDFDFVLSVAAHVTSSIPVAAALLTGNPLVGLGALAVNTVIGSKVLTNYYAVTGPWSNPTWKPVESSR